ncbi:MAG: TonB-dependent receptor [Candidatus Latescibacterota bacterium]
MRRAALWVLMMLFPVPLLAATLSGFITDRSNGESLAAASVMLKWRGPTLGTSSNTDGYYAIQNIPPGTYMLVFSYLGYESLRDSIAFEETDEKRLDGSLVPEPILTEEIVVEADRFQEERALQSGFIGLKTEKLRELPSIGEPDILRSLQLLPGIQAASDISSGLYIRGGGPDQTLILLDQIPLYNPSHAFGFFSTFNPDAIKDISLHKGAYPAQYGGRLGSVLDVRNRDGNRKDFQGTGGISLISTRLTLEGPLERGSWMASGRRTYLEPILWAMRAAVGDSTNIPSYYFYDLNTKFNHDLARDKVTVSGYFGRDELNVDMDEGNYVNFRWGNGAFTGKWTHILSPALFVNLMVAGSEYASDITFRIFETPIVFSNSIQDLTLKGDLDFFASNRHALTAGFMATRYRFAFEQAFNQEKQLDLRETPFLLSGYVQDLWEPQVLTSIRWGARCNYFSEGRRLQVEPRVSLSQHLAPDLRVKVGGGIYHQYLQLITTEGFSGADFWVPLDGTVEPGRSWQAVLGIEWEPSRRHQISLEGYFTDLKHLVALDNTAAAVGAEGRSEDVFHTGGTGYATGLELFVQRRTGPLTGWIGYTLGWTRRRFPDLNQGRTFPPKYDRRHDLSVVANYQFHSWSLGTNLVYGTGQAFTPAAARYSLRSPATGLFPDGDFLLPANRNSARLLPYHRLDLNIKRRFRLFGTHAEAYLEIFNAYSRRNEWFVWYDTQEPDTEPEVAKMLPIVPTLGINFEF